MSTASSSQFVCGFGDPACRDPRRFGGKAAGLAGLAAAGLPVAPGFVVGVSAFRAFVDAAGLRPVVYGALAGAGPTDLGKHDAAAELIARHLADAPMPDAVAAEIRDGYRQLGERTGGGVGADVDVAIRSSATAEDSATVSFAGEFETWVDVSGADDVLDYVRRCWTSVFSARAIGYALANRIDPTTVEMAVVVQKTVRASAAGVMFTISPVTGDRSRIVIEASWGLGLAVVGGEVTPDRWVVDKVGLTVVEHTPGDKRIEYRRGDTVVDVHPARWTRPCLTDEQVIGLATLGKRIERDQGRPQDIEFAVDADLPAGNDLVLLQRRPETVWSAKSHLPRFAAGQGLTRWISQAIA